MSCVLMFAVKPAAHVWSPKNLGDSWNLRLTFRVAAWHTHDPLAQNDQSESEAESDDEDTDDN